MCLSIDGDLYSFGSNYNGQLGIGNNEHAKFDSPQKIDSLKDVEFIECGNAFSFCKTVQGDIYRWGCNEYCQLGTGDCIAMHQPTKYSECVFDAIDIKCGIYHTLILTSNQEVYSCGDWFNGPPMTVVNMTFSEIKKIEELTEITRIECGRSHSMCINSNNDLYVFGYNVYGQLGLGDKGNRNKPIKHPSLSNIIDISKGGYSTFVKTSNNEIFCFWEKYFFTIRN